ncbi:type IV toxin-antitoxin system AbiEi family antitoxin [Lacisediminihabitans sp.]|uniref:type IV toxin-antitoxin system AbiEi family antitoxin n=1 Tax=Lacisediminihabitans sp. TaxID=2787631 RepID=UPI00374D1064
MSQRLPRVLSGRDLPLAELTAARIDGEVYSVDECFSPLDEFEIAPHRALALLASFPPRLIAERHTAAWVLGAQPAPPTVHQFCVSIEARTRPTIALRMSVREVVIDAEDLLQVAGLPVTTPLRTAVDLVRCSGDFDDRHLPLVAELMRIGGFGVEHCAELLNRRRNLPDKRVALARLIAAAALRQT